MSEAPHESAVEAQVVGPPLRGRAGLLQRHPWITFLLPLVVFLLVGVFEPTREAPGGHAIGLAIPYVHYPSIYTLKILLTLLSIAFVLPGYREFPLRVTLLAILTGLVGIVVWVGLCSLRLEQRLLVPLGLGRLVGLGARAGFNPFEQLQGHPAWAWGFLVVRFVGLVAVVPLVEEFFLRGFLMRFVMAARWWEVPMGKANAGAVLLATAIPMLMHPAEIFAAAAWFSMITWMYLKTRSVWDCVAAHAVTNLLLGIYVVTVGGEAWQLI
jgi:CAAX prenyl protease-like protein